MCERHTDQTALHRYMKPYPLVFPTASHLAVAVKMVYSLLYFAVLTAAQDTVGLNGWYLPLPQSPPFSYAQGGAEWEGCSSRLQQQSPVNINQTDLLYSEVNEDNSAFVPLVFTNDYIGDNFVRMDVSGTIEYLVFAGESLWNMQELEPMTQILIEFHMLAPSEHLFNGQQYSLELHLYYGLPRPGGMLQAIDYISIFFEEGEANPVIAEMIEGGDFDLRPLFPASGVLSDYFYYTGTEDRPYAICYPYIGWVFPNYVLSASRDQIDYYNSLYMNNATFAGGRGNTRLVQPLHQAVYHFTSNVQEAELPDGVQTLLTNT